MIETQENVNRTITKGLTTLETVEPITLSEWADKFFYLSPESSGESGQWECLAYQRGIMNCISNDDIEVITWQKSARTGYTKIIDAAIGYFAEHKKRSQVVYQPTDQDAKDFVKDEIDTMLRDVPCVQKIFPDFDKKSKNNTLNKKVFNGSTVDILGGTTPRNYRRLTKDVVFYDELDGFDDDVGGEGSATALGDTRITTSSFPKSIRGSTPRLKTTSQVEASLNEADVVLRYYLPCPHCETMQYLSWGGDKAEHGIKWENDDPETAHYQCNNCDNSFYYKDLTDLMDKGHWQSEDEIILGDDDYFYQDNERVPTPVHVGFLLWAGYSIFSSWSKLVSEYLKAIDQSKRGSNSKLKTFINTRLGESWEDVAETINPNNIYNRREHYSHIIPENVRYLTAGIDTQDDRFEYIVYGWGEQEECYAIDYVRLYGDLSREQIWSVLAEKLRKQYVRHDGSLMGIGTICHDSGGHYADEVYKFSKDNGLLWVIPIKGYSEYGKPVITFPTKRNAKGVYLTMVGTDNAKNIIYQRLEIQDVGAGYIHFPNNEDFNQGFFNQLVSERKELTYSKGKRVFKWVLPKGRRNEALDCSVYALAALRVAQQHKGLDLLQEVVIKSTTKKKPKKRKESWIK